MKRKLCWSLALAFAFAPMAAEAQTQTIDFELGTSCGTLIPNGYAGFNWSNFGYLTPLASGCGTGSSGYVTGTVSGQNVGFNWFANTAMVMSASNPFNLVSVWMTAAWNTGLTADVRAYRNNTLVFSSLIALSYTSKTLVTFNWNNIDEVSFVGVGGSDADPNDGGSGTHIAYDDMVVSTVPEPGTVVLLLTGLAGVGGIGLARRKKNLG